MRQNEDCVFCKCHECYMENINFTKRDSRRSARCQKISNEKEGMNAKLSQQYTTAKTLVECDHLNLNCCFDFSYFSREYIAVRQKKIVNYQSFVQFAIVKLLIKLMAGK